MYQNRLRDLREDRDLKQSDVAEATGIDQRTLSNYETGKSRPDIEMLTRIAETLETDPNTVLYGIPQKVNRERMVLKLCISATLLVIALIGYGHLADLARDLAQWQYDQRLSMAGVMLVLPILAFLFGWTAMQALGVFAKLSPLKDPWCKRMRWIVIGITITYLLTIIPYALSFILYIEVPNTMPGFLSNALLYTFGWLIGVFPLNALFKPNALIFGLLGCALWLGIPKKQKE